MSIGTNTKISMYKWIIRLLPFTVASFLLMYMVLPPIAFSAPFGRSHVVHWWDDRGPNLWNGSFPLTCDSCHLDNTLHHEDPVLFNDGKVFSETSACNSCHSPNGAFDGVNDATFGAKANWDSGVYTGTNYENLQTGKEQWCTTCHDDAAPIINGRTADNVSGNNIAYGYFISGHGKYDVTCTTCHDPQLVHIDDYDWTYGTTLDYTQGYRLKLIYGNTPMLIPRNPSTYNANQFRLCYSCHDEGAIYDVNPLLTDFSDLLDISQNNLHREHLNITTKYWDSDRSGETSPMYDSGISCPSCHNPHGKDYNNQATISMTRQDLGIIHKRDVTGLFGYFESGEWGNPGGDLNCFSMCHQTPNSPNFKYYYHLGARPPETPRFWTKLNSQTDVTNPTYGTGGTFLGGTFTSYDRYGVTETGLSITSGTQGCQFPSSNINSNDEYYGETIDFWYVPNFNFSGNTTTRFLFDYYDDANNFIRIRVVNNTLDFRITIAGSSAGRILTTNGLTWTAGSVHHIVCTWGPSQGMRMYLDRYEPSYSTSGGLNYYGGINQTASNFYIGRRYDSALPASGIIDDFKIYGYQYQNFEGDITLFSKMGSASEITTPIKGSGGSEGGSVGHAAGQQGNGARFSATNNGVVNFPTTNLNPVEDTIDLWYSPSFSIEGNADSLKHLFSYYIDDSNKAFIKVDMDTLNFTIIIGGTSHTLKTTGLTDWDWYHIVCTWGPDGMHIYIDDKEASYSENGGLSYTGGLPTTVMPANFQIGNTGAGVGNHCRGLIDELRVYGYQGSPQYLEFLVDCPVDIQVIGPNGRIVDKFRSEIWGAQYLEQDFNGDGSLDDKIIIPLHGTGNYTILVFPEPGANPEDTYTLRIIDGENTLILAKDVPVGNISSQHTYEINVTNDGIKFLKLLSPENGKVLSGSVPFDWESVGYDGFRVQFSSDVSFKSNKISYPNNNKWISETLYTPTDKEWKKLGKISQKFGAVYWRVIAIDEEGNIGSSETRSFTVR
jgi:hypothetical protein